MKRLETERLVLRAWKLDDVDDLYDYAKDPEIGPRAGWKPHKSKEESKRILYCFIHSYEVWAIEDKETKKVIGSIGLHKDDRRNSPKVKMLGYVLAREFWGMGLMTEAVKRTLEYAFEEEKLNLVSCYHYPLNIGSKRVIEKSNFKFEGILRYSSEGYDGTVYDSYCYSITKDEWLDKI